MYQSPVIILGMHRSGTTMITKMLENLGLFVGAEKEINNEALFFWHINNWIFNLHTATPEKPYNLRYSNPAGCAPDRRVARRAGGASEASGSRWDKRSG